VICEQSIEQNERIYTGKTTATTATTTTAAATTQQVREVSKNLLDL
jgi:hypothetical protein